jgi:phosphate transport system permease protein
MDTSESKDVLPAAFFADFNEQKSAPKSVLLNAQLLRRRLKSHQRMDGLFRAITFLAALSILLLLVATAYTLLSGAWPAIQAFGWRFFIDRRWSPVDEKFGALVPIYGTLVTSFLALLIAVPLSFGIALFLTELSPRFLKGPLGIAIELLAAVPSVIYGMWGLFIFAPVFGAYVAPWINRYLGAIPLIGSIFTGPTMGIGILPASIVLAMMVIPFTSAIMRDVFNLVPPMLKESAYGLGATTWEVVWNVVLPESRLGVVAGIMLGLGRALGETMAVTFIIGNSHALSQSLLMPGSTISSTLANEFNEAVGPLHTASLIELGLILFIITFVVLAVAKTMMMRLQKQSGKAA